MASDYPGAIDSFDAIPATLAGPPTHEVLHEEVHNAIVAVQTELGTNPAGAAATVAERLSDLPQGFVAYAASTSLQTGIGTSVTDLTGVSVNVTSDGTRRYRITLLATLIQGATATIGILYLNKGGTQMHAVAGPVNATYGLGQTIVVYDAPAAGTHTYKGRAASNAGTVSATGSTNGPVFILVEDIGAV